MTTARKASAVLAVALVAAGLVHLAMDAWQIWRVPDLAAWHEAAGIVRDGWKDGDVVVFSPSWASEGSPEFAGLDVRLGEHVDWYEAGKRPRVWVVGMMGHRVADVPADWSLADRRDVDRMTVSLYSTASRYGTLLYDFRERIRDAKVTRRIAGKVEDCTTFVQNRWHCGPVHPWLYVGQRRMDAGGAVRDVIWAHPSDHGDPLVVRWPTVPAGTLMIHYGFSQRAVDADHPGLPVTLVVKVGDQVVVDDILGEDDWDWREVVVPPSDGPGPREVTFTATTLDNGYRHLLFTADVWGAKNP